MAKIGTKLPHAGNVINGVRFSPFDENGERVSETDVTGAMLDVFKEASGFYVIPVKKTEVPVKGGKAGDPPAGPSADGGANGADGTAGSEQK